MQAVIIGSGGAIPQPDRTPCSVWVTAAGKNLVFDLGPGVLSRLAAEGLAHDQIEAILISHFHMDHTLDLWAYFFAAQIPGFPITGPVMLVAPPGLSKLEEGLRAAYGHWAAPPPGLIDRVRVEPARPASRELFPGLTLAHGPASHKPESTAYRLEADGRSLVYTGDTGPSDELIALAAGADVLITECSFPDDKPLEGHLTPTLAGRLAARAKVGRLVLTHLYPPTDGQDLVTPAEKAFGGPVMVAHDGLRLNF